MQVSAHVSQTFLRRDDALRWFRLAELSVDRNETPISARIGQLTKFTVLVQLRVEDMTAVEFPFQSKDGPFLPACGPLLSSKYTAGAIHPNSENVLQPPENSMPPNGANQKRPQLFNRDLCHCDIIEHRLTSGGGPEVRAQSSPQQKAR